MADFCRQCTEQDGMPGGDYSAGNGDLQKLVSEEYWQEGYVAWGICEGCAGGQFDPDGYCLGGCYNGTHRSPRPEVEEPRDG